MAFNELGSQSSSVPKTPTLRQWIKNNPDSEVHCSLCKIIFKPTAYASYTFVTEHDFKVVVEKNTVLDDYLQTSLCQALDEGGCLYILIKDRSKGSWSLARNEGSEQEWSEFPWGWKAGEVTAPTPPQTNLSRRGTIYLPTQFRERSVARRVDFTKSIDHTSPTYPA